MNCLIQKRYLPCVHSSPWCDVMRPLLSSSDKREEVAPKKGKSWDERNVSTGCDEGSREQCILNTWSSLAAVRSHLYRQSQLRCFLRYSRLHCRIALTPQALPTANVSQIGTSLLTMETSPSEIAITGTPVSMHLGYFRCLLQDGTSSSLEELICLHQL